MKKKICSSCNKECYLFKSRPPLCSNCYKKQYSKPINKVSESHKETLKQYSPKRKEFLKKNPYCQLHLQRCTKEVTCIHHKKGKSNRELYLDEKYWMASCINCNNEVERIGKIAYEKKLKLKRNETI